jgi:enoyl-CoA hydratase
MELKGLLYEKEGNIAIITLDRPKVLNALNDDIIYGIITLMDQIAEDDEVKAVIITGGPKAFAAGGDIAYMAKAGPVECEMFIARMHKAVNKITDLDKPVIAAIAGLALGGGLELALACDIRMAAEGSLLGLPETNLGLFPAGGGTQKITRMAGISWAKDMVLTGDPITADTALKIGLITRIVPAENLLDEAKKLARKLARKAPVTTRITKQNLNNSMYTDLAAGLLFEQKSFAYIFSTEDHLEGMNAFLEKRRPEFKGR